MKSNLLIQTARILGFAALAGTILPPLLVLTQNLGEPAMKAIMLVSALVWFASAPLWMKGGEH